MICWCSYCQRFQGEKPLFDDYRVTHTLCDDCAAKGGLDQPGLEKRLQPIVSLFDRLASAGRGGDLAAAASLVEEGLGRGLQPQDLLVGLLQPVLYQLGSLWERGELSVAAEHRGTAVATAAMELVLARRPGAAGLRQTSRPRIVLANADGNYHVLGVRMVEFVLVSQGVPCFAVFPGLPSTEVYELALSLGAPFVGLSVAVPAQIAGVRALSRLLERVPAPRRPRLLVGGHALRSGSVPVDEPGVELCRDVADALKKLQAAGPPGG
jgi:methanogenic corrinoid protein MtbC1